MIGPYVLQDLAEVKQVTLRYSAFKPTDKGWSATEQHRFWEALTHYPQGPWTSVSAYIGTKTTRQTMTHAQNLRQKLVRWKKRACVQHAAVTAAINIEMQQHMAQRVPRRSNGDEPSKVDDALEWLFATPGTVLKTELTSIPALTTFIPLQPVDDIPVNAVKDDCLPSIAWDALELPSEPNFDHVCAFEDLFV